MGTATLADMALPIPVQPPNLDPELESSKPQQYRPRKPQTRVVNLGRFHKVQDSFSKLNEEMSVEMNQPIARHAAPAMLHEAESRLDAQDQSSYETSEGEYELPLVESPIHEVVEDNTSTLVQSQESFLTGTEDSTSPLEHATTRILAVLKSYLHDLENGMLFTEFTVDPGVANALKELCDSYELVNDTPIYEEWDDAASFSDMSNEMGVIREVKIYREELRKSGDTVAEGVYDAAQAILFWDMV